MALSKAEGPFDRPFDRLTVLSKVEGLTVLSKAEGQCSSAGGDPVSTGARGASLESRKPGPSPHSGIFDGPGQSLMALPVKIVSC